MNGPMNLDAYDAMSVAEREYLYVNGWSWDFQNDGTWWHEGFARKGLTQGHAVNVQKQHDRAALRATRRA